MAMGVVSIAWAWRDLGVEELGPHALQAAIRLARPIRALLCTFGALSATMLLGIAADEPWLEKIGFSELPEILSVMALRPLLTPLASMRRMKLRANGLSGEAEMAKTVSGLARLFLVSVIAVLGGGAMALVVPYAIEPLLEASALAAVDSLKPSPEAPALCTRGTKEAARLLTIPTITTMIISVRSQAPYLTAGFAIPIPSLGLLFFASQTAAVPRLLLRGTLQRTATAMLSRANGNDVAERGAFERMMAIATLFVPAITLTFTCIFPALERALFDGKWASATPAVVILSIAATFSGIAEITTIPLRAKHRLTDELVRLACVALCIAASVGWLHAAAYGSDSSGRALTVVSVGAATGVVFASLREIFAEATNAHLDIGDTCRLLVLGLALAGLAAIASASIGGSFTESLQLSAGRLTGLIESVITAVTYAVLMILAIRFTAESTLRDLISILPPGLQRHARRLFLVW